MTNPIEYHAWLGFQTSTQEASKIDFQLLGHLLFDDFQ